MRSSILLLILFTFYRVVSYSQPKDFKIVDNKIDFAKKLAETAKNIQTIKSDFKQEKNIKLLSEKMILSGEFWFKKQNMVRMDYMRPLKYVMIINKDKVILKDEQKINTFSSKANKLFITINNILMDCVRGTALDNNDFTSSVFENHSQYLLILTPQKKEVKDFFTQISIYLEKSNYSVSNINMMEPAGDYTLITFSNKRFDVNIPDEIFSIK